MARSGSIGEGIGLRHGRAVCYAHEARRESGTGIVKLMARKANFIEDHGRAMMREAGRVFCGERLDVETGYDR